MRRLGDGGTAHFVYTPGIAHTGPDGAMTHPTPGKEPPAGSRFVNEAILVAGLTGVLYMMTSAREVGYQDLFGFRYIALDTSDITDAAQRFAVPLVLGLALSLAASFLTSLVPRFRQVPLGDIVFPLAPLCFAPVLWYDFEPRRYFSPELWELLIAYYVLDHSFITWLGKLLRRPDAPASAKPYLRIAQATAAALVMIVFAYDTGRREAVEQQLVMFCPGESAPDEAWIVVQQTGDLTICAALNQTKHIVYREFRYFKIPDGGEPKTFKVQTLEAKSIGVVRGSEDDK
jgi:hypothetical protein